jgi:uncharacterized ParB-like nuclease family protein
MLKMVFELPNSHDLKLMFNHLVEIRKQSALEEAKRRKITNLRTSLSPNMSLRMFLSMSLGFNLSLWRGL